METFLATFLVGTLLATGGVLVGVVIGGLIWRNNSKKLPKLEEDLRKLILDKRTNAEQTLLHIRNKLNV